MFLKILLIYPVSGWQFTSPAIWLKLITSSGVFFLSRKKKNFPENKSQLSSPGEYEKIFSGYKATHYRVKMKGETRYSQLHPVEIQVASVLMHAWSEVEHDLVYKPFQGNLSREEHMILDEINGLVLTGNLALERLQQAGRARTEAQSYEFKNHYDLTSYFISQKSNVMTEGLNFRSIFKILKAINRTKRSDLIKLSSWIDKNKDELGNIYSGGVMGQPFFNEYNQALYSIVSVFNDEVKLFLADYPDDDNLISDVSQGYFKRLLLAMRDYFKFSKDFKKTYSLSVALKKNLRSPLTVGNSSLDMALKSVNLKLESNSSSLTKALNEYYISMQQWSPEDFTIEKCNRLFSLNASIKDMVAPIRAPRRLRRPSLNQPDE
ncbi:hypothetical protein GKC49_00310 [Pantoea agglomerans]|uniref:RelA/SpoT domain-containing protein n=1 Tax=Enterobacter agglomerans TaxID=549 RepID=A0A7X2MI76_ENTAG|nr:hypothetical protein [Pantoea agglomerans]